MARKTKDEAERTRNAIIDAAENVFYTNGVTRTTLEQVALEAGVTRGAVYWHFKDKLELCEAMMRRVFLPHEDMLEELAARTSDTPIDDLRNAYIHALRAMDKDKRRQKVVSIMMLRCEYVAEMAPIIKRRSECKNRMTELSEKLFERAKKLKMLATGWTPRKAAVAAQALVTGLIVGQLEQRKHFDFSSNGKACIEAFFQSLKKNKK